MKNKKLLVSLFLTFTLASCGSNTPSVSEVESLQPTQ